MQDETWIMYLQIRLKQMPHQADDATRVRLSIRRLLVETAEFRGLKAMEGLQITHAMVSDDKTVSMRVIDTKAIAGVTGTQTYEALDCCTWVEPVGTGMCDDRLGGFPPESVLTPEKLEAALRDGRWKYLGTIHGKKSLRAQGLPDASVTQKAKEWPLGGQTTWQQHSTNPVVMEEDGLVPHHAFRDRTTIELIRSRLPAFGKMRRLTAPGTTSQGRTAFRTLSLPISSLAVMGAVRYGLVVGGTLSSVLVFAAFMVFIWTVLLPFVWGGRGVPAKTLREPTPKAAIPSPDGPWEDIAALVEQYRPDMTEQFVVARDRCLFLHNEAGSTLDVEVQSTLAMIKTDVPELLNQSKRPIRMATTVEAGDIVVNLVGTLTLLGDSAESARARLMREASIGFDDHVKYITQRVRPDDGDWTTPKP